FQCTSGGGNDSGWQDGTSYEDTGLSPDTQYCYAVQARDKSPNQNATAWSTAECATTDAVPDTDPPTPDPATFASPPAAVSSSEITMTASTGSDASPPVEYLFDETSDNPGGTDSGWVTSETYNDTGLDPNTQYTYTVQMRDSLANTGTASAPANATTDPLPPDSDPPTPDPATFALPPTPVSSSQITMTATTGSDASPPVEYYFDETSGNPGGSDSGWVTNPVYNDTGLQADTTYTYTVTMRDSLANTGTASAPANATTDQEVPTNLLASWYFGNGTIEEESGSGKTATLVNGASISGGRMQMSDGSTQAFDFSSVSDTFVAGTAWTVYLQNAVVTTNTNDAWLNYLSFGDSSSVCPDKRYMRALSHSVYPNETTLDDWCVGATSCTPKINGSNMDLFISYDGVGNWTFEDVSGTLNTGATWTVRNITSANNVARLGSFNADLQCVGISCEGVAVWDEAITYAEMIDFAGSIGTDVRKVRFAYNSSGDLEPVTPAVIDVVLYNPDPAETYTVDYNAIDGTAVNGADFDLAPGTLTFIPGDSVESIVVDINDDGEYEPDETFDIELFNPTGVDLEPGEPSLHTYTIMDPRPFVSFDQATSSADESAGTVNLAVSLSHPATETITVDFTVVGGTAVNPDDYTISESPLTFDVNDVTKNIVINLVSDGNDAEGREYVYVRLADSAGALLGTTLEHRFTINGQGILWDGTMWYFRWDDTSRLFVNKDGDWEWDPQGDDYLRTRIPDEDISQEGQIVERTYFWLSDGDHDCPDCFSCSLYCFDGDITCIAGTSDIRVGFFQSDGVNFSTGDGSAGYNVDTCGYRGFVWRFGPNMIAGPTRWVDCQDETHKTGMFSYVPVGQCDLLSDNVNLGPGIPGFETPPGEWTMSTFKLQRFGGDIRLTIELNGRSYDWTRGDLGVSFIDVFAWGMRNGRDYSRIVLSRTDVPDTDPPNPDPMSWAIEPYSPSSSTISMTATTANDKNGVQYYFECTTDPNHDSGWQNNAMYVDTGLTGGTQYTYRVKARDLSFNLNETAYSPEKSATTLAGPDLLAEWYFGNGFVEEVSGSGEVATLENGATVTGGMLTMVDGSQQAFDFSSVSAPFVGGDAWTVYLANATITTNTNDAFLNYLSFGDDSVVCDFPNTKGNMRVMSHNNYPTETSLDDWCKGATSCSPKINGANMDMFISYDGMGAWSFEDLSGTLNTGATWTVQDVTGMGGNKVARLGGFLEDLQCVGLSCETVAVWRKELTAQEKSDIVGGGGTVPDPCGAWYFGNGFVEEVSGSGKVATLENGASINGGMLTMVDGSTQAFDFSSVSGPFASGTAWTVYLQNATVTTATGGQWLNYLSFGDDSVWCDFPNTKGNMRVMSHSTYPSDTSLDDWCKGGTSCSPKVNGSNMDLFIVYDGSGNWTFKDASGSLVTSASWTVQDVTGMGGNKVARLGGWHTDLYCVGISCEGVAVWGTALNSQEMSDAVGSIQPAAPPETDPPTPDPATFASPPAAMSSSEITMTATTGTDASPPVEYFFDETSGNPGGSDSGWVTNPVYNDTGLDPDTQYTYTVQMRDSYNNTGTASAPANATTTSGGPSLALLVDVGGCGPLQSGWVGLGSCGTFTNVDGAGIDVTLATGNPSACACRNTGGTGALADVETDLLFADDEQSAPNADFILTLGNLTNGTDYQVLSYHNRSNESATTIPNVTVTGATNVTKPSSIVQDHPIMDNPAEILFTAGAGNVVIRYEAPSGGCGGCQAFFNGFELYELP
ncbi:MAG: Calx-beta domain-containing protein, partial [Planctomycetota bacterium]